MFHNLCYALNDLSYALNDLGYALNVHHYRHPSCYMDSGAFSAFLVESVLNKEPLSAVWVAELEERSQILNIILDIILNIRPESLVPAPPTEATDVLEPVNQ